VEPTAGEVKHVGIVTVKENYPTGKILIYNGFEGSKRAVGAGADIIDRLGDSAGVTKWRLQNYDGADLLTIDSLGAMVPAPSGGGATIKATTITAPYPARKMVQQTVVDAAVTATSKITISLGNILDTDVNCCDDIDLFSLYAVPGTGSFSVRASFLTPFGGPLKLNYMVT
jgi:hypothetical protein